MSCAGYHKYGFCSKSQCRYTHSSNAIRVPEIEFLFEWEFSNGNPNSIQYVPSYNIQGQQKMDMHPPSNANPSPSPIFFPQNDEFGAGDIESSVQSSLNGVGVKRVRERDMSDAIQTKKPKIDLNLHISSNLNDEKERIKKNIEMRRKKILEEMKNPSPVEKKEFVIKRKTLKTENSVEKGKESNENGIKKNKNGVSLNFDDINYENPQIQYTGLNDFISRDFRQKVLGLLMKRYAVLYPNDRKLVVKKALEIELKTFKKYRISQNVYWSNITTILKSINNKHKSLKQKNNNNNQEKK